MAWFQKLVGEKNSGAGAAVVGGGLVAFGSGAAGAGPIFGLVALGAP